MKVLKRMLKQEKGAITMTVLAAMLFITTVLVISYFSIFNLGSNQNRKIQQISKQYSVTDGELEERYNQILNNLDLNNISITQAKKINSIISKLKQNTTVFDEDGNSFVIPAGFKLSSDSADKVTEGIVIEDATYNDTIGSEFVWIPVVIPWKTDSSKTITLARYEFKISDDETSGTILQTKTDGSALRPYLFLDDVIEEGPRETGTKNAVSKDINDFILKTNKAKGFWIGRYEARTTKARYSTNDPLTVVTEKPEMRVYNYITQTDASAKARTMYEENDYFQSDLMNSYAWDTATLFLQEYDNRTYNINTNSNYKAKYSNQIRLSTGLKNTGTNNLSAEANKDKICNVYDMADNCLEWTTETYDYENYPCVKRGGNSTNSGEYTSRRSGNGPDNANRNDSFRPLLYVKN